MPIWLAKAGVDCLQGYLYGAPGHAPDLAWITRPTPVRRARMAARRLSFANIPGRRALPETHCLLFPGPTDSI